MLAPSSVAWLLRHEMKLVLRGRLHAGVLIVLGVAVWLVLHVAAWSLLQLWHGATQTALATIGTVMVVITSLMLAQAIALSVDALFVRGDLDLLLASPISPRTVFLVRLFGVASVSIVAYGFFVTPFANVGAFTGHAGLLAIYPVLISLSLLTASAAMALTLALVRWLGARRARVIAQVLGAIVGAAVFLVSQAPNMIGGDTGARLFSAMQRWTAADGPLGPLSGVWWPARAVTGDWLALLAMCALAIASFWAMGNIAVRYFLAGTQQSVTGRSRARRRSDRVTFAGGVTSNALRKEWKLIARDPSLIAQTLLQVLYALPLVFLVARRDHAVFNVMPLFVLIGTTLSGTLAWLTVAAEDAPELVGTAPVSLVRLRWIKVAAAIVPVLALVAPLIAWGLRGDARAALLVIACLGLGTLSAGAMQVWYPQRGRRTELKRRARSSMLVSMLELITGLGWSALAWTLVRAPVFALAALPFALLGPALAWVLGRERRAAMLV